MRASLPPCRYDDMLAYLSSSSSSLLIFLLIINDERLILIIIIITYYLYFIILLLLLFFWSPAIVHVSILFSMWQSTPLACSPPSSSIAFSTILESQEQENTNLNRYVPLFTVITYTQQNHISLCECWMVSQLLL